MVDLVGMRLKLLARKAFVEPWNRGVRSGILATAMREPGYGWREPPLGPFSGETHPPTRPDFLELLRRKTGGSAGMESRPSDGRFEAFRERLAMARFARTPLSHSMTMIHAEPRFTFRGTQEPPRRRAPER